MGDGPRLPDTTFSPKLTCFAKTWVSGPSCLSLFMAIQMPNERPPSGKSSVYRAWGIPSVYLLHDICTLLVLQFCIQKERTTVFSENEESFEGINGMAMGACLCLAGRALPLCKTSCFSHAWMFQFPQVAELMIPLGNRACGGAMQGCVFMRACGWMETVFFCKFPQTCFVFGHSFFSPAPSLHLPV